MIVILDSGVLHTLVSTSKVKEVTDCQDWFYYLLSRSALVVTSSLCNYEVKRELIRRNKVEEINNLNQLKALIDFLPVDDPTLELAAELWAEARNQGLPTADDNRLDADVIICAQYQLLESRISRQICCHCHYQRQTPQSLYNRQRMARH